MNTDNNKKIIDAFRQLDWPNIRFDNNSIIINKNRKKLPILTIGSKEIELNFYWYDARSREYNLRNDIISIKIPISISPWDFLNVQEREYKLPLIYLIKNILNLEKTSNINKIKFIKSKRNLDINLKNKTLTISVDKYLKILKEARVIYKRVKRHKSAYERYLTNLAIEKFSSRVIERRTLISPGDINFTIQRLNLPIKKKISDFNRFVNKADINATEGLATAFIKYGMFSGSFLKKLNDYFIKENLQDIIQLGKEILALGSPRMDTDVAKGVIFRVNGNRKRVGQLETLWQSYFRKYLLYLIFSYKGIFPKIQLTNIEGDKKYPDFIGINHYNGVDIIEIKTHLKNALVHDKNHDNFAFSSELSKAIIQTMNYMDAVIHTNFRKSEDREKITNSSHEENLNRPRGIIIISSYAKLVSRCKIEDKEKLIRDFTKLRNSVQNIEILTFDEILDIAHDYIQNIINKKEVL